MTAGPDDTKRSYDRVAEEYARRLYDELRHKPLDRELLDRFAADHRSAGPVCDLGCGGRSRATCTTAGWTPRASTSRRA